MSDSRTATIDGVRLRYRLAGSGPALVVQSPGWGIGCAVYEQSLAPLEASATTLYYDTRGSGGSQREVDPATFNVGQFVADLEGLRAELGLDRIAILGHSHGGYIAMNYALTHPERVSRLVLVGSQIGPAAGPPSDDFQQRMARLAQRPEYADAAAAFMGPWDFTTDAEIGAFFARALPLYFHDVSHVAPIAEALRQSPPSLAALGTTMATDGDFPVLERFGEISAPVLVVGGRHDFVCPPSQMELLHSALPNAELVILEQSGHFPFIEEPEAFVAAVSPFLAG